MGKKIAFRISCCESDPEQPYAAPSWVERAGAKGLNFGKGGGIWEPDYGARVFLNKVENFLKVFANRYDDNPNSAYR